MTMITSNVKVLWRNKLFRLIIFSGLVLLCFGICYFASIAIDLLRLAAKIRSGAEGGRKVQVVHRHSESSSYVTPNSDAANVKPSVSLPETRCSDCSAGFCTTNPDLSLFSAASTEIQAFFNLTFHCVGEIVAWKVLDQSPSAGKVVYLDVLKYDQPKDEGTWMGFNKIVTTGADGWVTYEIPQNERIRVEPGVFICIHYDDIAADPVVPFADEMANPANFPLSDGFTILMDHQELTRYAKVGVIGEVAMSKLFNNLLVQVKRGWRAPAVSAIVLPIK